MFAKKTRIYGIAMQGQLSAPPILMAGGFSTVFPAQITAFEHT
jgi:hypothetical protein